MKKIMVLPLLSIFAFSGLNINMDAEAKKNKHKVPPGHAKHHKWKSVKQAPKVIYVQPVIYRQPLVTYRPGTYYFYDRTPATISFKNAQIKGYIPLITFSSGRWTLTIK